MPMTRAPGGGVHAVAIALAMVPVEVRENWLPGKPKDDRVEVLCTYSNFRRFQVTYGEQIK